MATEERTDEGAGTVEHGGLRELRAAVVGLEERVTRLESALVGRSEPRSSLPTPTAAAAPRSHLLFARLALGCFALVGALLLRTAARQGWLAPEAGAILGLTYCGALLLVPAAARRLRTWEQGIVLQILGLLLAPVVILETTLRLGALSVPTAAGALGAVGLAGAAVGDRQRSALISGLALLGPLLAVAALASPAVGTLWRGLVALELCGLGLLLARRRGWPSVRSLLLTATALVLATGVLLVARRSGVPPLCASTLLSCAAGLWVMVVISTTLSAPATRFDRASFPFATLWLHGLGVFVAPQVALPLASGAGAALLILGTALTRGRLRTDPRTSGVLVTGACLSLCSLPWLDRTGIALALAALVVQHAAQRLESGPGFALSQALALAAVGLSALPDGPWPGSAPPPTWIALACGSLLFAHYAIGAASRARPGRWLAPLSLVGGVLVIFDTLCRAAYQLLGPSSPFTLSQTVLLGALSTAALALGRWRGRRALATLGLVGTVLLAAKVLLWDITALEGGYLVASVLTLGLNATATSLLLRTAPARAADQAR